MADPNTDRVLSFDGGGERGYLSLCWFNLFVQQWGISQSDIWKYFNVICGTSIGGIISLALAYGLTPAELFSFFTEDAPWIFTIRTAGDVASGSNNASLPSNRPNSAQKVVILGNNDQFYTSVHPTLSNYGTTFFQKKLTDTFGDDTLQSLKCPVIIPSYQTDTKTFVMFSNVNQPGFIGQNYKIVDVARATSAAPFYLSPYSFGGHTYMDGGVYQNNPANFGLTLSKMMKPLSNRACILSIGTGLGELGFDPGNPDLRLLRAKSTLDFPYQSTIESMAALVDASLTGSQEAVAQQLLLASNYTPDGPIYYRFQPNLDQTINTELDNTDSEFLTYLQNTSATQFANDNDNISTFLGHLIA